jgi:hypothetical protein
LGLLTQSLPPTTPPPVSGRSAVKGADFAVVPFEIDWCGGFWPSPIEVQNSRLPFSQFLPLGAGPGIQQGHRAAHQCFLAVGGASHREALQREKFFSGSPSNPGSVPKWSGAVNGWQTRCG